MKFLWIFILFGAAFVASMAKPSNGPLRRPDQTWISDSSSSSSEVKSEENSKQRNRNILVNRIHKLQSAKDLSKNKLGEPKSLVECTSLGCVYSDGTFLPSLYYPAERILSNEQ
jgi:hypothetical protein